MPYRHDGTYRFPDSEYDYWDEIPDDTTPEIDYENYDWELGLHPEYEERVETLWVRLNLPDDLLDWYYDF